MNSLTKKVLTTQMLSKKAAAFWRVVRHTTKFTISGLRTITLQCNQSPELISFSDTETLYLLNKVLSLLQLKEN